MKKARNTLKSIEGIYYIRATKITQATKWINVVMDMTSFNRRTVTKNYLQSSAKNRSKLHLEIDV